VESFSIHAQELKPRTRLVLLECRLGLIQT